jgi:hypothetical protein
MPDRCHVVWHRVLKIEDDDADEDLIPNGSLSRE